MDSVWEEVSVGMGIDNQRVVTYARTVEGSSWRSHRQRGRRPFRGSFGLHRRESRWVRGQSIDLNDRSGGAYNGQVGKVGGKGLPLQETPGVEATPPSPLANVIETPRDVSCMYELQSELMLFPARQYQILIETARGDVHSQTLR